MTDIVERLRLGAGHEPADIMDAENDMLEAADEIENLRANAKHERSLGAEGPMIDLTDARQEIERLREVRENEGNEIERLQADRNDWKEIATKWAKTNEGLHAEIERLRTTLGYLADNIDNPALVAVAEAALKPKP